MGEIKYEGDPPYSLPVAQSASASAVDETVELTLRVIVPGKFPSPAPIRVQMTIDAARDLQAQMIPAIRMAEVRSRAQG
jgi:hypothetical protein